MPCAYDFDALQMDGRTVPLRDYQGRVLLIVNTASACGFTPQFAGLQDLHRQYANRGLVVLGFPCNQFGAQEPGSADEIQQFCSKNYGVTFDLFAKVDVNGEKACPLYKHLKALPTKPKGPGDVAWNFEKFLIGRGGEIVARFDPTTSPDAPEVVQQIERELARK